ncbi:hypothetical protein AOQ84DRAFT_369592 [Glonium stellatum]|uniref:Uncharacterized protein n=1 Tax=Glonium stellatum TaxID=574774 RepID=A0A8E2JLR1_9PEZI|nr:hypothetical protein AOQ84DRAFT_369592 [Glonium stellatum]
MCEQLSQKVRNTLSHVHHTDRPSDWNPLVDMVRRWARLFMDLVEEIHQKGGALGEHENWGTKTVYSLLTYGMDETLDLLRPTLVGHWSEQTSNIFNQLEARVALHSQAVDLMLEYLRRESSRHTLYAQMEFNTTRKKWFDQKADLEARLKHDFQCTSRALLWTRSTVSQETSSTPSSSKFSISASEYFLQLLHIEATKSLFGFPVVALEVVMRVCIYLLETCAWVFHNLVNYPQLRTAGAGIREVAELMLGRLMFVFHSVGNDNWQFPTLDKLELCDLSIRDPLNNSEEPAQDLFSPDTRTFTQVTTEPASLVESQFPYILTPCVTEDEMEVIQPEHDYSARTAPAPLERRPDELMRLLTTFIDNTKPLSQQLWIPSCVKVFRDQSNHSGDFYIIVDQGVSVHKIIVNPETDEIVPEYAFRSDPPVLLLRQRGKDCELGFSTSVSEIGDLADFASIFFTDIYETYFPIIDSVSFGNRKGSWTFSHCSGQVWTVANKGPGNDSGQNLQGVDAKTSNLTLSPQRRDSVEPISGKIEASRILLFCSPYIFTIITPTDEGSYRPNRLQKGRRFYLAHPLLSE